MITIVPTAKPKRKRRWPQFSLATLFAVVTGAAVLLGIDAHNRSLQRAKILAIYSAALRHVVTEPPYQDQYAGFLSLDGTDPPRNFAGLGLLPVSQAHVGAGSDPNITVYDKITGRPGYIITLQIVQLQKDRVKIKYESHSGPLHGHGFFYYLRLIDGKWQFDGEDEMSHWVS